MMRQLISEHGFMKIWLRGLMEMNKEEKCKRYRKALEKIANKNKKMTDWHMAVDCIEIAEEAINEIDQKE